MGTRTGKLLSPFFVRTVCTFHFFFFSDQEYIDLVIYLAEKVLQSPLTMKQLYDIMYSPADIDFYFPGREIKPLTLSYSLE